MDLGCDRVKPLDIPHVRVTLITTRFVWYPQRSLHDYVFADFSRARRMSAKRLSHVQAGLGTGQ